MCSCWAFFILEEQSVTSETQIMTGVVSQKESRVLRPGERAHMLGMPVGDSGVFEKHQFLAQDNSPRMLCEAGRLLR